MMHNATERTVAIPTMIITHNKAGSCESCMASTRDFAKVSTLSSTESEKVGEDYCVNFFSDGLDMLRS
jgi:hypothetical protein